MNRKLGRIIALIVLVCTVCTVVLTCGGCMNAVQTAEFPSVPEHLNRNKDGVPVLKVYNTATDAIEEMDIETYIMGVVAGEMKNSWPMEALKAQAILARTFTMKFVSTKKSSHAGADISTDVQEAQAYNADDINDRVREAVNETRGIVMAADGDFAYAWFHAHSGGMTELPTKALEYSEDPSYLRVVSSKESEQAPNEVKKWTAEFTLDEAEKACAAAGAKVDSIQSFTVGEKGDSGRAISFLVNGQTVSAPAFRLQIGASELKSTLIESIELKDGKLRFTGSGFGHGVGMSQWGAYQMADEGKNAEDIIKHYFTGIELTELW